MNSLGALSLLPVTIVIILVLLTRRTATSLFIGSVIGSIILWKVQFLPHLLGLLYGVITSYMYVWIILVCGLFGSLVKVFEESGGVYGFSELATKFCTNKKRVGVFAWLLGVLIFSDDTLSVLTLGAAMTKTADRLRVTREKLALIGSLATTSACVLVPISTWGIYMTSQIVAAGVCDEKNGLQTFIHTIPFMFYPIISLIFAFLVAIEVIPEIGPIRNSMPKMKEDTSKKDGKAKNMIIPVVLMTIITIATSEVMYGIGVCLIFCLIYYVKQGLMTWKEYLKFSVEGFKSMIIIFRIATFAFLLRDVNKALGMPEYIIGKATAVISASTLPMVVFLLVMFLGIIAGNFWGICAISFPVIIPIAVALNANLLLVSGAIISATTAGAELCFFGSEITIVCSAMGITNTRYLQTCLPMISIPVILTAMMYLLTGILGII